MFQEEIICKGCQKDPSACKSRPTPEISIGDYECPGCYGVGCEYCNHGRLEIDFCPLEFIDDEIWETLESAHLYLEHGLPPVAGGQLDQSQAFLTAARFISSERAAWQKDKL